MLLEVQFETDLSIGDQIKRETHSRRVYRLINLYVIMAVGAFHSCTLKRT